MRLQDVINAARHSELGGVAVRNDNEAIITFLNLGMLELHKRFPLKMKEHVITLQVGVSMYALPDDYMYILSASDDSDTTAENPDAPLVGVSVNDNKDQRGIFIPSYQEVQVPSVDDRTFISLIYVAKPTNYTIDNLEDEVDLPETLINCLLHYIGYKGHLGIKGDAQSENNAHWFRFDRACKEARDLGVAYPVDTWAMPDRLGDRGFV